MSVLIIYTILTNLCVYMYIYIYRERERDSERESDRYTVQLLRIACQAPRGELLSLLQLQH